MYKGPGVQGMVRSFVVQAKYTIRYYIYLEVILETLETYGTHVLLNTRPEENINPYNSEWEFYVTIQQRSQGNDTFV